MNQNPKFKREGFDIISEHKITLTQAIIGGDCEIKTINGKLNINIPQGTQMNQEVRIKGEGLSFIQSNQKGDHVVIFKIQIPKNLSKKQQIALENY